MLAKDEKFLELVFSDIVVGSPICPLVRAQR